MELCCRLVSLFLARKSTRDAANHPSWSRVAPAYKCLVCGSAPKLGPRVPGVTFLRPLVHAEKPNGAHADNGGLAAEELQADGLDRTASLLRDLAAYTPRSVLGADGLDVAMRGHGGTSWRACFDTRDGDPPTAQRKLFTQPQAPARRLRHQDLRGVACFEKLCCMRSLMLLLVGFFSVPSEFGLAG